MEIADEIRKIAEEKLSGAGQFIVDVIVTSKRGPKKILIILDGDTGITIDDCANLNRELSKELEALPALQDSYLLEVSTPGLDQPLKLKRQYRKNVGRRLNVKLADKAVEGKLVEVTDDKITLEQESLAGKQKQVVMVDIEFSEIDKSFVLVSFK
jgi:ribosome maturation factor RimP